MRETPNCQDHLLGGDQPCSWKEKESAHFWGFKETFLLGIRVSLLYDVVLVTALQQS